MPREIKGTSPINIMKHTKGLKYPTSKAQIISQAQKGPGPDTDQIVELLNKIPDKSYGSPAEIVKETSKAKK